jgi:alpha-galactosidase
VVFDHGHALCRDFLACHRTLQCKEIRTMEGFPWQCVRPLLHSGRVVRADAADPAQLVHGVVASDRRHALFSVAMLASATTALPPAVRMPGLDLDADYTVRVLDLGRARTVQDANPAWFDAGEVRLTGRMLAEVGLPMPLLAPENALVFELVAD